MRCRTLSRALVVLILAGACHSWQSRDISTGVAPAVAGRSEVRVTRSDKSRLRVEEPRIEGDSLTGRAAGGPARITMPLSDVHRVETREFSKGRTALVVGSIFAFMLVFSDR
jgi:hypothetical protein